MYVCLCFIISYVLCSFASSCDISVGMCVYVVMSLVMFRFRCVFRSFFMFIVMCVVLSFCRSFVFVVVCILRVCICLYLGMPFFL